VPQEVASEKEVVSSRLDTAPSTLTMLIALVPSWLALAWLVSKAQWYWNHKPDMHFGWIVLGLSAFAVWDQWKNLPAPKFVLKWLVFLLAILGSGLLFLVQIYTAAFGTSPAVLFGLCIGVFAICAANVYYLFGYEGIRFFRFPLLFLLVALPLPSAIQNPVVGGLQSGVTAVNVETLRLIGIPAERVGNLIHLPNGTVGIDEACSGIRSLQSTIMATLFIGYFTFKRRGLQAVLLASGILLAFVGNLGRSLYLSVTANSKGLQAVEQLHDSAGWSILMFTAAGVAFLAWRMFRLEKRLNRPGA
jgi:exosortase